MLAQQRQQTILERVRSSGGVRVADLVRELGVSDMTIRRDLEVLAERGLVEKVHGGATVAGPGSTEEPGFAAKSVRQQLEKEAITRQAAQLGGRGTGRQVALVDRAAVRVVLPVKVEQLPPVGQVGHSALHRLRLSLSCWGLVVISSPTLEASSSLASSGRPESVIST